MAQKDAGPKDMLTARGGALRLLDGVLMQHRLMSDLLSEGALESLSPPDRARAQRLAAATLRALGPIDALLAPRLAKLPPVRIRNILRLAVLELTDSAAAHGIVNEAVDQARAAAPAFAGLVNAVLRRIGPSPVLQGGQELPKWLRSRLLTAWGRGSVALMEKTFAAAPPLDITLRPGALPPPGAKEMPTGSYRLSETVQVSALPGFAEGQWWVQDAAAAVPARLLAAKKGERVLDLCAAPGGKTLQLAAAGADVTALDISEARLVRLRENLARTGLSAHVVAADALTYTPDALFDAVLLDAPCSATGTIRRHPDLPFAKDASDLGQLIDLQARLIDRAISFLKPGGRLVYATCSLLPEEGEGQLDRALQRHPGWRIDTPPALGLPKGAVQKTGGIRLKCDHWAERGGMDGFFIMRMSRG